MKIILTFLLFSGLASAEIFRIHGELVELKARDGLLLKGCEKDCLAVKAVKRHKKISLKKIRAKEQFVGSVGSDVCRLVYQANSVIGTLENLDQRAFCVFKDESLIEINSLSDYLMQKKIVVE